MGDVKIIHAPRILSLDVAGQWSYIPVISKGNQARLRKIKPMNKLNRRQISTMLRKLRASRQISIDSARFLRDYNPTLHANHIRECVWAARRYNAAIVATLRFNSAA